MRKSRSAHVKCSCGKKTNSSMWQRESIEGDKESCSCNYDGRCICAFNREQSQLDTVPESNFDEDSNNSARPKTGSVHSLKANTVSPHSLLTFGENGHHNPALKHADAPQMCGDYELNYEHSLHNMSSLGNSSINNHTHTDGGEFRSGSLAAYQSHQEQGQVTLETVTPELCKSNISTAFQQLSTQLPLLGGPDIECPANTNSQLFGDLSDATQAMFGAELSTTNINWTNCDLSGLSSHNQAQDFSGPDSDWFAQPTLATIFPSTWGGVPEVRDFGTPAEVLRHSAATLPGPILHGLNATVTFSEAERLDGQPSPAIDQGKLS